MKETKLIQASNLSSTEDGLFSQVSQSHYESPEVKIQRISLITQGGSLGTEDSDPPNTGLPG